RAAGLGEFGVAMIAVTVRDHPARTLEQYFFKLGLVDLDEAFAAGAAGHIAEHLVDQFAQLGTHFAFGEGRGDQAYSAIDVESDAARRLHAVAVVGGRHPTDGEAVPLVNVGHGEARSYDARQRGDVHGLLEREVLADLVEDRAAGVDDDVGVHASSG